LEGPSFALALRTVGKALPRITALRLPSSGWRHRYASTPHMLWVALLLADFVVIRVKCLLMLHNSDQAPVAAMHNACNNCPRGLALPP
jgi:hypothetical protein